MIIKQAYSKIISAINQNKLRLVTKQEIRLDRLSMTPHQYWIANGKGMERPFTGLYCQHAENGMYYCVHCRNKLFSSETKYNAQTGFASFYLHFKNNVKIVDNNIKLWQQVVQCMSCKSCIGQFSKDGPPPTFLRYSINSAAIKFVKEKIDKGNNHQA